jgi:hypothetical protein
MGHVNNADLHPLLVADPDGDAIDGVLYRLDESIRWVDFHGDEIVERRFPK